MEGRAKTMETIESLKQNVPGFEKAKLRNFGMTLGQEILKGYSRI